MNRPAARASVIGHCATWHCLCGNPVALQGRSGPASGPTRESAVVCGRCGRVYFVIPMDRSHGPPIEVVELFGLPVATEADDPPANAERPRNETSPSVTTSP